MADGIGTDDEFLAGVVDRLSDIAGVVGLALGGSRAQGRARSDSDWDLGVFVDGRFSVAHVRAAVDAAGWTGTVAELGEWGPVMNGGAWLEIDDRRVDLLWREVDALDELVRQAHRGEFRVVRVPFFVAGIPSYVPVGELSVNQPRWGVVPEAVAMPEALSRRGATWWTRQRPLRPGLRPGPGRVGRPGAGRRPAGQGAGRGGPRPRSARPVAGCSTRSTCWATQGW